MKKMKRLLSIVLTLAMIIAMIPYSATDASATYNGTFSFDDDGKFTVMQLTDIQDNADVDNTVISMITKAIARYSPDLVVLTGDNVAGNLLLSQFKSSVDEFLQPLINTNTKFAVTFGNHDGEGISPSKQTQYDYYMSHGGSCAVDMDVQALTGAGNGVIPIYANGQSSGTPEFQLYVIDSGDDASSGYDCVYGDQIDYYIQRSIAYPTVPSLWFMHIAPIEYYTEIMDKVSSGTSGSQIGNGTPWSSNSWSLTPSKIDWIKSGGTTISEIYKEPPCPANQSTYESSAHRSSAAYGSLTNYQAWVNYGNVIGCYVGHDHKNSFVSTTDDGIDFGYGKAATLNSYNDGNPGCRIFELNSNGSYTTQSVTNNDLQYEVGDYTAVNNAIAAARFVDNGNTYFRANNINDPNYYNAASTTVDNGIYPASSFVGEASDLSNAIDAVIYGLNTQNQATINVYANAISSAWQALMLKTADYTASNQVKAYANDSTILAPPYYNASHSGQWLPRGYYTNSTLSAWDAANNAVLTGLKVPSQATVNGYASALSTTYQALRLRDDISYTVEYECNGVKITADKLVNNKTIGTLATESYLTIPNFEYMPDPEDVNGTKSITLGLTNNVIRFNYSGNVNVTYKVEHYEQNVGLDGYTKIQTETIGGTINSLVNAIPVSYSGFSYNPGVAGTIASGTVAGDGSLTLKIYYVRNTYSVTFNANGGTGGISGTATYGLPITTPAVSRTGYTFTGWSPAVPATVPANATTYTAQWQVNNYLITFEADGGSGGSSGSIPYGSVLSAPDVYRAGYTFTGWAPTIPVSVPAMNTTYTAQWNKNSYTITFDANDGIGGTSMQALFGVALIPPNVEREGYDFVCWFPDAPTTVPAADSTYTAIWGLKTFTINFDANGGTGGGSLQTLITGEHIDAPLVLRTGYTFLGWSPEVPPLVPADNATYTAQWSRNSYRIVFDANGGDGGYSSLIFYGEKLSSPEVTKPGSIFAGWTPVVPSTVPAEDMTFTAHWSISESLITFDANGGIGTTSGMMPFGAGLIAPNVVKPGHTLTGWEPAIPSTVPVDATVYTAQWSINNYSATFDENGGTGGTSASYVYDSALQAPIVSKPGFTFVAWSPSVPEKMPAANSVFTAQWVPTNYNVTFNANGGTGGSSDLMPYGAALKAPAVAREGYTFTEWLPNVPASVPIGNATYTAQWSINSYSIVFDANGGIGGTSGTYIYGSILNKPNVVRQGYTFTGWDPVASDTVPGENKVYVAQWSQNTYTVTFDDNNGDGGIIQSLVFGADLIAPIVTRIGYTFTGWSPYVPTIAPNFDVVYTAQWTVNTYNLTFNANGGSGGTNKTIAYGTAITPPVVKKNGYTFTGWTPVVPATMPANAIQFTATWTINMHDAVFVVDGVEISRIPTAYGNSVLLPPIPVKEGNVFLGWDPGVPSLMPDESRTFTAVWYTTSFSVSFNLNGGTGTVPAVQALPVGSTVVLPKQGNITKPGCRFLGWNTDFASNHPLASYQITAENITLFAIWDSSQIYIESKLGSTTVLDINNNVIFGLETELTKEIFENNYITINGNGRIEYLPNTEILGTGSKVTIIDNATDAVLQTYYIVIFGDVNGDGNIDSTDSGVLVDFENYKILWNTPSDYAYRKAADLNSDGNIDSIDAALIVGVENSDCAINQETGTTYRK